MSVETSVDLRHDESGFVKATILFPQGSKIEDVSDIFRIAADGLDEQILDDLPEDDFQDEFMPSLSVVAERNRRMLDEIIRGDPGATFQRPIGNGEL